MNENQRPVYIINLDMLQKIQQHFDPINSSFT